MLVCGGDKYYRSVSRSLLPFATFFRLIAFESDTKSKLESSSVRFCRDLCPSLPRFSQGWLFNYASTNHMAVQLRMRSRLCNTGEYCMQVLWNNNVMHSYII